MEEMVSYEVVAHRLLSLYMAAEAGSTAADQMCDLVDLAYEMVPGDDYEGTGYGAGTADVMAALTIYAEAAAAARDHGLYPSLYPAPPALPALPVWWDDEVTV